ncbi:hypothetical protein ELG83_32135 (plasmid) [Rhizobium leguminosarum]|mgnify:CR=1 FL=1|uniref:Uncharacterized protein n=1 Tax=Rhizobium johnstonii (strain DSM 114642 / LMG 32736 / 3841) TaxID=216596 RepID=Q1M640_RHIJ3|nr:MULTISPECIES: hypothetical protein [Rhizobium]WSH11740.1 hypothetical protein U8P72_29835 [Rhizobium johnstonii]MBY5378732.1 hypothetical protein [Rhizobium leguminosarum]NEI96242.1 hypothetical protein [Rhizobium leguminosarum]NEJ82542.1 hypothetical protein [Rhizobium leguminosarum]TBF86855.1 hypothetical protein ELG83_32135 [Rhizobium leguminosarum]
MEAHPDLSDDRRNALLQSLTAVGLSKPLGYLPLYTIEKFLRLTPKTLADAAAKRSLARFKSMQQPVASRAVRFMHTIVRRWRAFCRETLLSFEPLDFLWTRMNLYSRSLQYGLRTNT